MFAFIKKLLGLEPKVVEVAQPAPYKVETPAEVGKPADDRVEAPANLTAQYKVPEPAATTPIPLIPVGTEASIAAPAKAPAKKQQFEKKPAATKAAAKPRAPAKPRAKKAPAK